MIFRPFFYARNSPILLNNQQMTTYQPVEQSLVEEESDLTLFLDLVRSRSTGSWINQDNIREVQRFNDFRTIDWVEDELDAQRRECSG